MKELDDKLKKVSASQTSLFEVWGVKKDAHTINEFFSFFASFHDLFMKELGELEKVREQAKEAERQLQRQKEMTESRRQGGLDAFSGSGGNMSSTMVWIKKLYFSWIGYQEASGTTRAGE